MGELLNRFPREALERFRYATKVILLTNPQDPNVLLFKHRNGYILLPGGKIETQDWDNLYSAFQDPPTLAEVGSVAVDRELEEEGLVWPSGLMDAWMPTYGIGWKTTAQDLPRIDFAGVVWIDQEEVDHAALEEITDSFWMPLRAALDFYVNQTPHDGYYMPNNIWGLLEMANTGLNRGDDFLYRELVHHMINDINAENGI